jgi:hypothetical protein
MEASQRVEVGFARAESEVEEQTRVPTPLECLG